MARPRLPIALHLPHDEVARRDRAGRDGREKTRWQILWLLTRLDHPQTPAAEVAAQVGLTPSWARTILKRWNAEGPAGLADRRKAANGGKPCRPPSSSRPRGTRALSQGVSAARRRPLDRTEARGGSSATRRGVVTSATRPAGVGSAASGSRSRSRAPDIRRPPRPPSSGRGKEAPWPALGRRAGRDRPEKAVEVWAADEGAAGARPIACRAWVVAGPPADGERPDEVRVALRLRLRPPGQRAEPGAAPAGGGHRLDGGGAGRVRPLGRPRGPGPPGRAGGQRRLAHGEAARGAAEPAAPPPAVVYAGVAAGRALRLGRWSARPGRTRGSPNWKRMEAVLMERCRWLIDHTGVVRWAGRLPSGRPSRR